jgi:hypothetical protein
MDFTTSKFAGVFREHPSFVNQSKIRASTIDPFEQSEIKGDSTNGQSQINDFLSFFFCSCE